MVTIHLILALSLVPSRLQPGEIFGVQEVGDRVKRTVECDRSPQPLRPTTKIRKSIVAESLILTLNQRPILSFWVGGDAYAFIPVT